MSEKKKRKFAALKTTLTVLGSIIGFFLIVAFINLCVNWNLRSYIKSFSSVEYGDDRLIPVIDSETGYYTYTTDEELKILQITDVHLGGGIMSVAKDKKAINAVITMIQTEKPDLVVFTGDNCFAVPYISGGTNNAMTTKTFNMMAEKGGAYYTTVFGNHDSEIFNYSNRNAISNIFEDDKWEHCIYQEDFNAKSTKDDESNQMIVVKKTDGSITKALLMIDSMAYKDHSLSSVLDWQYATISDEQVDWAVDSLNELKEMNNNVAVKALAFIHIPIGEYKIAFEEMKASNFADTANSHYVTGVLDETDDPFIWYGGYNYLSPDDDAALEDKFFEKLTEIGALEYIFCGHDHLNSFDIEYKDVHLTYGYSIDYLAYTDIDQYGLQRGTTVIKVFSDGTVTRTLENYYQAKYVSQKGKEEVNLTDYYYEGVYPQN